MSETPSLHSEFFNKIYSVMRLKRVIYSLSNYKTEKRNKYLSKKILMNQKKVLYTYYKITYFML